MTLIDPRNSPDWDLAPHEDQPRTYVIASTPRTGSTLLCRALWDTGLVGAPKEYLNPTQVRDWITRCGTPLQRGMMIPLRGPLPAFAFLGLAAIGRPRDRAALRDRILREVRTVRTGPSGWFGLKLHHHHKTVWFGSDEVERVLGPVTWVRVRREDRLGQALSWVRARQTGVWASHQRAWGAPRYDPGAIRRAMDAIATADAAWDRDLIGRTVLDLTYEGIADDLEGAVRRALAHLGIDASPTVEPALTVQRDALTARWRTRWEGP